MVKHQLQYNICDPLLELIDLLIQRCFLLPAGIITKSISGG